MVDKFFLILMACASLDLVAAGQRRASTPVVDLKASMFVLSGYGSSADTLAAWHVGAQVAAQAQDLLQASAGAGAGALDGELISFEDVEDMDTGQGLLPSGLLSPDDKPRFLSPSDRLAAAMRGQAPQVAAGAGAGVGVGSAVVEREDEKLGPIKNWGDTDIFAITTPEGKEAFQKRLSHFAKSNPRAYKAYKDVMVQRRAPGLNQVPYRRLPKFNTFCNPEYSSDPLDPAKRTEAYISAPALGVRCNFTDFPDGDWQTEASDKK